MRRAAVDLGTNSSRLLIVETTNHETINSYRILTEELETTRLGAGITKTSRLTEAAVERTTMAVEKFNNILTKYEVDEVKMVGTSALREVENSEILVQEIKKATDLKLEIISGREEARLSYLGASLDFGDNPFLLIDIGGGSTEFIWPHQEIEYVSLNIGAVRLTELFVEAPTQPLTEAESKLISQHIKEKLKKVSTRENLPRNLVGVGGTVTSLAAVFLKLSDYDREKIHRTLLSYKDVSRIYRDMAGKTLAYRKQIQGLNPERADIIVCGIIILKLIMEELGYKYLRVSEYDLLFGIIEDMVEFKE